MRTYEVMIVTNPDLDSEQQDAIVNRITKFIADGGGTVRDVERWGRRRLAYEIAGHRDGEYTVLTFQAGPQVGYDLERVIRLTDGVIRHLIVKREA